VVGKGEGDSGEIQETQSKKLRLVRRNNKKAFLERLEG